MKIGCRHAALLFAYGLIVAGCTHAQARVDIPPPALDVPAPPPRVIETTDAEVPQPVGLAGDPADAARPAPPRVPATPSPRPSGAPAARTEPPKPETPPAAEVKPPDEPRPTPALRAAPTQQEAALERSIRDRMFRASTVLDRIELRSLNADARDQFNRARSFIREADDALRERNFTFAGSLVDKAVAIAAQLGGR